MQDRESKTGEWHTSVHGLVPGDYKIAAKVVEEKTTNQLAVKVQ